MPKRVRMILLASLVGAGCTMTPPAPQGPAAAVGRVTHIGSDHGYVIASFPDGPRTISVDHRDLEYYSIGSEIFLDSSGRPLRSAGYR
jgi:hypothetical protein